MTTVWILTEEYNDYDQHGEYFVEAFEAKPTTQQLIDAGVEESRTAHVLSGGGRIELGSYYDNQWYHLREHTLKEKK